MTDTLPPMDVAARLDRLRAGLAGLDGAGCDALAVTSLTNIRYLTGFTGSAGMLLLLPAETVLITDGRYATQSAEQLAAAGVAARIEVAAAAGQKEVTVAAVQTSGVARLGLEAAHVSWARQRAFAADWFPAVELVATEGLVEALRRVKDAGELARLARAADIADAALAAGRPSSPSAGPSTSRCAGSGRAARPSRPSSRRGPTRRSPTTAHPTGGSSRGSWWCSTSAPSSTGTAPT